MAAQLSRTTLQSNLDAVWHLKASHQEHQEHQGEKRKIVLNKEHK